MRPSPSGKALQKRGLSYPVKQAFTSQVSHDSVRPTVTWASDESSNMIGFCTLFCQSSLKNRGEKSACSSTFCLYIFERKCVCVYLCVYRVVNVELYGCFAYVKACV